ncbi:CLUMA_CG011645, isoform A [Clunio marinus]|uniref:CLUMA_CG011645, isoform A n=1 Tax=Clunio marinus TaxID=568069 RepID=A0A1J1IDJ0_9DIPT|nr:CLUMA_CG011645, isoform A [Clunio marinus]
MLLLGLRALTFVDLSFFFLSSVRLSRQTKVVEEKIKRKIRLKDNSNAVCKNESMKRFLREDNFALSVNKNITNETKSKGKKVVIAR